LTSIEFFLRGLRRFGFASLLLLSSAAATAKNTALCLIECNLRIGIVSAFGAEADIRIEQTQKKRTHLSSGNHYTAGVLRGNPVVIVLSGVSMINSTRRRSIHLHRLGVSLRDQFLPLGIERVHWHVVA
jgi:adenosylhomocysteine nucleosidase